MENPLLKPKVLPDFSAIRPELIEPALLTLLAQNRDKLKLLLEQPEFSFDNLIVPLEEIGDHLAKFWSPIAHLQAVMETDALRAAYNACLPHLTEYYTQLGQNLALYKAVESIAKSPAYSKLTPAARKVIDNDLRDFRLAGVHLAAADKEKFALAQKKLSKLSTKFAENLLDATHAWVLHITDKNLLAGLPEDLITTAAQNAEHKQKQGWLLTLDQACYTSVMKSLEDRNLRQEMYTAYVTRASDQGPHAGKYDNTPIMQEILSIRFAMAKLLGFSNYAEYSLATKMASSSEMVFKFLHDLVERARPYGQYEMEDLHAFAKATDGIEKLAAWDIAYYSEKQRLARYDISEEELRAYFPADKVIYGMFEVIHKLYGVTLEERPHVDLWHPQVKFFDVYDKEQLLCGSLYMDLYARAHKREGAWMDEARVRRRTLDGDIQLPVAYLTCNFSPPLKSKPSFLTFDEVLTLFHEFGHCLHHLLTQVEYASVSGINGVPWDAVEFPSQFLEFWCYEKEVLTLISAHKETGKPIDEDLYQKLHAAKNFHAGLHMLRQLEFALFDFRIHTEFSHDDANFIQKTLDAVRSEVSVMSAPPFNRFQHSFAHIFAGGYAAGYYSYKWAEVLASDAFSKFEEKGIFDAKTGAEFLNILKQGGVVDPMALFVTFRERVPSIEALLRHSGLNAPHTR